VAGRDPHFFPEQGLPPHRPSALLLWEADEPDHVEDVDGFDGRKVSALLAHRSQFRSTMHIDDPDSVTEIERFRGQIADRLSEHGRQAGLAMGEAFKLMKNL
jgi:hypothetical protein